MNAKRRILLEIALESADDAVAAVRAGADRIELCAGLDMGGLTPSAGALQQARRAVSVPLLAMIRPRNGGFCYTDSEYETMRSAVESIFSETDDVDGVCVDGIVVGILHADGTIDTERCERLARDCPPCDLVFHRAFDLTPDPFEGLETLISLRFTRILTSGGCAAATETAAIERIAALNERAAGRIEILPGSGIRADNVGALLQRTKSGQIHAACRERRRDMRLTSETAATLRAINGPSADAYGATDWQQVAALRQAIDRMSNPRG